MNENKLKPFAVRVEHPVKMPTRDVVDKSIKGLKKGIKSEVDSVKRSRLKDIKREMQWLKDRL